MTITCILPEERHVTPALSKRVTQSEQNASWVHGMIDGLAIPSLPTEKRLQLAGACWAAVIDYHQGIVLLTRAGYYGSARALIRPLFEAYIRGVWLKIAATDHEVETAGQDRFPRFGRMIDVIEVTERVPGDRLTELKAAWWGRMSNLADTGSQQIGTRLTPEHLGNRHHLDEIVDALTWADWTAIQAVRGFGMVAGNTELVRAADEQVRTVIGRNEISVEEAIAPADLYRKGR
jgi:hypothetical protein